MSAIQRVLAAGLATTLAFTAPAVAVDQKPPQAEDNVDTIQAAFAGGRLVCLRSDLSVAAWTVGDLEADPATAKLMRELNCLGLDAEGSSFWIYSGSAVVEVREGRIVGQTAAKAPRSDVQQLAFFKTNSSAVAVFADAIVDVVTGMAYPVPELGGQLKVHYLRPLCYGKGENVLWIGTGQGEWGGHLVGFDLRTHEWKSWYDGLHYVTGIAVIEDEPRFVSWSMSHFMANTLFRSHDASAKPRHSYPEFQSRYFQAAMFNPHDKTCYAIEQSTVGRITQSGGFRSFANLGKMTYRGEPNAIGVAPGVQSIVPIAADTIAVIMHDPRRPPLLVTAKDVLSFAATSAATP